MSRNIGKSKLSVNKAASAPALAPRSVAIATAVRPPEIKRADGAAVVSLGSAGSTIPARKPESPVAGQVTFQLVKPGAKNVCVAGSFNEWRPERAPLARVGSDRWVRALPVRPGRYEYLFVVDGQWLPDPNARESVQNPYGGTNSVLTVSE